MLDATKFVHAHVVNTVLSNRRLDMFQIPDLMFQIPVLRFQVSDFGFHISVFRFQLSDWLGEPLGGSQISGFRFQLSGLDFKF